MPSATGVTVTPGVRARSLTFCFHLTVILPGSSRAHLLLLTVSPAARRTHASTMSAEPMTEAEIEEEAEKFKAKFESVLKSNSDGKQSDWPMMSESSVLRDKYIEKFINILKELRRRYPSFPAETVCGIRLEPCP